MEAALNVCLCSGQGDVHAIGDQRGGVKGAEGTIARLAAHVVEHGRGGRGLRGGRIDAATGGAVYGYLVATYSVEGGAAQLCLCCSAVLHGGAELCAVALGVFLLAGGETQ